MRKIILVTSIISIIAFSKFSWPSFDFIKNSISAIKIKSNDESSQPHLFSQLRTTNYRLSRILLDP
jgi:hypothetical protein